MDRIRVDPERERGELELYLGADFELGLLQRYERTLAEEAARIGDEQELYRTSRAYLYNLTAFAMTRTKEPYLNELVSRIPSGARVLDYGCGIGSDGLALAEAGYRVEFADFDNPSTEYLRWRLRRRGLELSVHDLDRGVPGGFDAAFAFDVIEHTEDPEAFLGELESRAALVAVNLLAPDDDPLHRPLPIRRLTDRAVAGGLVSYRLLYGRSHLLVYRSGRAGAPARLAGRARIAAERLRARMARPPRAGA